MTAALLLDRETAMSEPPRPVACSRSARDSVLDAERVSRVAGEVFTAILGLARGDLVGAAVGRS
jgi:hypothetical protein